MTKLSPTAVVFLALTAVLVVAVCIAVPVGMAYSTTNSTDNSKVPHAGNSTVNETDLSTETAGLRENGNDTDIQSRCARSRHAKLELVKLPQLTQTIYPSL